MKDTLARVGYNIFSIICLALAATLIIMKGSAMEGWGWFMLLAFLTYKSGSPSGGKVREAYDTGHADGKAGIPLNDGWADYTAD